MRKLKGFTLIELLIVVAIIAILAAIAIPNFLDAQIRARVARTKADMRSAATAIEAYMVDTNFYPASYSGQKSVNYGLPTGNARYRMTFANYQANMPLTWPTGWNGWGNHWLTLTTPTAYIGAVPTDNFASEKAAALGYAAHEDKGWIMWSYGPDSDESTGGGGGAGVQNGGGQVGPWLEMYVVPSGKESGALLPTFWGGPSDSVYAGGGVQLTATGTNPDSVVNLKIFAPSVGGASTGVFCYDPSNGTSSMGDVISVAGSGPIN